MSDKIEKLRHEMTLNFEKLREEIKNNSRIPDNGPGLEDKPYTIKIINEEQVEEDESDLDSSS